MEPTIEPGRHEEHTLSRVVATGQPSRVLCLHWTELDVEIARWRDRGDGRAAAINVRTVDLGQFWRTLKSIVQTSETYWVFGWKMYEFVCAAGIADAIYRRRISITNTRGGQNDKGEWCNGKHLSGLFVAETCPLILDIQLEGGGKVKILDLANYGLAPERFVTDDALPGLDDVVQAVQDYFSLCRELDLGKVQFTAAGQGYYCYRRSHMTHGLHVHPYHEPLQLERASYYGGRCEARRLGKIPGMVYHLDVSAMYSSIAATKLFPSRLMGYSGPVGRYDADNDADDYQVIADVTLTTCRPRYPVKHEGKTLYPVGTFRTTLAGPEYMDALFSWAIVQTHQVARYAVAPVFASFARWYFASLARLELLGLDHLRPTLKRIVNSTYGKIGQRRKEWITRHGETNYLDWQQWWQAHPTVDCPTPWRAVDGVVQYLDQSRETLKSMPCISATMTSYGRMMLNSIIDLVTTHGEVYYCDTDSVMVDQTGYDLLLSGGWVRGGPGGLRLVEQSDAVEIFGMKHYRFGKRLVCAGLPQAKVRELDGRLVWEEHTGFSDALWHGQALPHEYRTVTRKNAGYYRHGKVRPGGLVDPWVMDMVEDREYDGTTLSGSTRINCIVGSTVANGRQPAPADSVPVQ